MLTRQEQGVLAMGLTLWQLRRPECLQLQPSVVVAPDSCAKTAPTASDTITPTLWLQGAAPAWFPALVLWLQRQGVRCAELDVAACQPADALLPMESGGPVPVELAVLPGYAGKRAVWRALCALGWRQNGA